MSEEDQHSLNEISEKLSAVLLRQEDLERRFGLIHRQVTSNVDSAESTPAARGNADRDADREHSIQLQGNCDSVDYSDLQGQFQSIKDSLQRVRLPPELKLSEQRRGVRANDKAQFNCVTRSARYIETALKVIATVGDGGPSQDDLNTLFTILRAHMGYLQDEHAAIVVQGQFDPTTSRFFRALQSNTSGFTPASLECLRNAAAIAAVSNQQPQSSGHRGYQPSRGRGFRRGQRDNYSSFTNRQFPQQRYNGGQGPSQGSRQDDE